MKPWVKGTSEGRLYVDTKHPEWKKWFVEQIEKYSKLNILKTAPPMSGEQEIIRLQKEIEGFAKINCDLCHELESQDAENAALKAALAELTDFTESLVAMHAHAYAFADAEFEKMAAESKAIIDRAKKLLDKTE